MIRPSSHEVTEFDQKPQPPNLLVRRAPDATQDSDARPSIELHIERILIDDLLVAGGQRAVLQSAVETELARLLIEQGFTQMRSRSESSISGGSIQMNRDCKPAQLGHQIALAILDSLAPATPNARLSAPSQGPTA
ncbi:MAG: hypothetical protein ABL888_02710 [Pirellulaceae bacterium]